MRLIDADLLDSQLFTAMNIPDTTNEDKITYAVIMAWVNLQPTVDAVPVVKHGKWTYDEEMEGYSCSVCGRYIFGCGIEALMGDFKYCPYCGARLTMESEGEKNEQRTD